MSKNNQKIEKIFQEIRDFCGPNMLFTEDQASYIKKSLHQAYLAGRVDTLEEQIKKGDK